MSPAPTLVLARWVSALHRVEDGLLVAALGTMIVFAVAQILLRNLFGGGIVWADPLLRVLVLWVGLIGAMVASRTDHHIAINVLSRLLPPVLKVGAGVLVALFTATVCAVITYHGARFVLAEYGNGVNAVGHLPVWVAEAIIPVAFGVMALRYAVLTVLRAWELAGAHTRP